MEKQEVFRKVLMNPFRIKGISWALFSKNNDDLSINISMEENYQKSGAKSNSGANIQISCGQNNKSALKD